MELQLSSTVQPQLQTSIEASNFSAGGQLNLQVWNKNIIQRQGCYTRAKMLINNIACIILRFHSIIAWILHELHCVRMSYLRISPFLSAVQKNKLLFDVKFWTENWVLHFEIPFYLISNTVVIGRTVGLSIRKQTIFRAVEVHVSR